MKNIIALIPARLASSRFPGKPLIDICGKTMIEHVWQRVRLNNNIDAVYIATCDLEIKSVAESFGADVIMTSDKHQRGTDRIAEGCLKLIKDGKDFDIVFNIQGDEPLLNPNTLDLLIKPFLEEKDISCVNLIENLENKDEINDYNNVKAIFDQKGFALYFSRLPIPNGLENKHYKQLGLYGFKKEVILKYPKMDQTPLEIAESDDMLRFIENGIPVKVVLSPYKTIGIDTPADYEYAAKIMENDEIFATYKNK
jgi:3-deoxy-manno-octulosonate cytidylyltransferase (CMP-KDO synthetase)